jgi:hypothetical protein
MKARFTPGPSQDKLLDEHGKRMEQGTAGAAISYDSQVETVGTLDRPENKPV